MRKIDIQKQLEGLRDDLGFPRHLKGDNSLSVQVRHLKSDLEIAESHRRSLGMEVAQLRGEMNAGFRRVDSLIKSIEDRQRINDEKVKHLLEVAYNDMSRDAKLAAVQEYKRRGWNDLADELLMKVSWDGGAESYDD